MRRALVTLVAACVAIVPLMAVPGSAAPTCATGSVAGEWIGYGGDAQGTRTQPLENTINTGNAASLVNKWSFSSTAAGGSGDIPSSALISGGCAYVWTKAGWVFALNADDGAVVWSKQIGGVDPAAPVINNGVIYFSQNSTDAREGIHAVALDAATGQTKWVSESVGTDASTATGAVYGNGLIMLGTGQGEFAGDNTGGFALIDAETGALVKRTHNVPAEQEALGYPGCSIWAHAAVDPVNNYAYVGTGQPGMWDATPNESENCDAIVKIDLDRTRSTFGTIVGARKGTPDDPPYVDVDFGGGGATLTKDANGREIAVQIQKSGWVHAAYTGGKMHAAWSTLVSPVANTGSTVGNYTGITTDGTNLFTVGAWPGQVFSLNAATGAINWVTPIISPVATNPMAYANGVLYYSDEKGFLDVFDAATGIPLLMHPIAADNSACVRNQSGGISIARHKVYAVCGPVLSVYGL
jgi:outer membrane protein assembly factor BamB